MTGNRKGGGEASILGPGGTGRRITGKEGRTGNKEPDPVGPCRPSSERNGELLEVLGQITDWKTDTLETQSRKQQVRASELEDRRPWGRTGRGRA